MFGTRTILALEVSIQMNLKYVNETEPHHIIYKSPFHNCCFHFVYQFNNPCSETYFGRQNRLRKTNGNKLLKVWEKTFPFRFVTSGLINIMICVYKLL